MTARGWAYAGTALGALTSIAANVADAYVPPEGWQPARLGQEWSPDTGAVLGSVFWPLALLVASETLARKRWAGRWSRTAGVAAVLVVALVAAVISYEHLHSLLVHYQETDLAAAIGPLAVDGLMIVCSLALVAQDAPADTGAAADPPARATAASTTLAVPLVAAADQDRATQVTVRVDEDHPPAGRVARAVPSRVDALLPEVLAAIDQGILPTVPTAEAIRRHTRCGASTARALRDRLPATT